MSQLPVIFNQTLDSASDPVQIKQAFDSIRDLLNSGIEADNIKAGAVGDAAMGSMTIDDTKIIIDAGTVSELLGALANAIKLVKGTLGWKDSPEVSLHYLMTNKSDVGHNHGLNPDGHTHTEFSALDILGVARTTVTNMLVTRDTDNRIASMTYTVAGEETGTVEFHRNSAGRLDCERLSNSLGTEIQIEIVRGNDGLVSSIYRSGFNAILQSGLSWPIT